MSCRPTPRVTATIAVEGISKGMTEDELRATMDNGRLISFEVTLE